jgi:heme-degrading monooxygenase HmoA
MIARIWHGWTTLANAQTYELLLRDEIFVGIQSRRIPGFSGIRLLRRSVLDEVEFVTIMMFDSIDSIKSFAGSDFEQAVVPPAARAVLLRYDQRSQHYEVTIN